MTSERLNSDGLLAMPLVRKIDTGLWEVRSNLPKNRISRVLFTIYSDMMILLHAFIKKLVTTQVDRLKVKYEDV